MTAHLCRQSGLTPSTRQARQTARRPCRGRCLLVTFVETGIYDGKAENLAADDVPPRLYVNRRTRERAVSAYCEAIVLLLSSCLIMFQAFCWDSMLRR